MQFRPDGRDNWYQFAPRHNPDKDLIAWTHSQGDFSALAQISFERHIERMTDLLHNTYHTKIKNPYKKIKSVLFNEPARYPMGEVLGYLREAM